jgi:lactate dehydrogenase-like 2-hydroxyacid dehydrogenase
MRTAEDDAREIRVSAITVGVIGLGAMGGPMAANLLRRPSTTVRITARNRDNHVALIEAGAQWCDSPRTLAAGCGVVLLMLPDLPEVEAVLAGPDGLLAADSDDRRGTGGRRPGLRWSRRRRRGHAVDHGGRR